MDNSLFYDISVLPSLIYSEKTLFITMPDESLENADVSGAVRKIISEKSAVHLTYSGSALPVEDVQQLYDNIKEKDFSFIVAVGGGTVMDIAKIVALALSNKLERIDAILADPSGFQNVKKLIFVPTTCGTGSEATHFAVVYKTGKKYSVAHHTIRAEAVILDPSFLINLPEKIRNATVLDALSQAVESMWAKGATEESSGYAKEAVGLILKGIQSLDNIAKLKYFQKGSYLAGKAINISKTTAAHAISYPLTAKFKIPHGVAVFLTLPYLAEMNFNDKTLPVFDELFKLFNVRNINDLSNSLKNIMNSMGFITDIYDYGVTENDFESIAGQSIVPGRSDNNPVDIDIAAVIDILKKTTFKN
ncbi:MAG TPA: phosphonoacetaldehyde reductase [bacterium]|nr:phosphonoacetaldehyde reductase [bacterium]